MNDRLFLLCYVVDCPTYLFISIRLRLLESDKELEVFLSVIKKKNNKKANVRNFSYGHFHDQMALQ